MRSPGNKALAIACGSRLKWVSRPSCADAQQGLPAPIFPAFSRKSAVMFNRLGLLAVAPLVLGVALPAAAAAPSAADFFESQVRPRAGGELLQVPRAEKAGIGVAAR